MTFNLFVPCHWNIANENGKENRLGHQRTTSLRSCDRPGICSRGCGLRGGRRVSKRDPSPLDAVKVDYNVTKASMTEDGSLPDDVLISTVFDYSIREKTTPS